VATCSFSSGFSNGFEICVAAAPTVEPMRGVPSLVTRRRRLRAVELSGAGIVALVAYGKLSAGQAIAAKPSIMFEGRGLLTLVQAPASNALVYYTAPARLAAAAGLSGAPDVASSGIAQLQAGFALAGECSLMAHGRALAVAERGLAGMVAVSALLAGDVAADDEETALALLGMPSEVLA